MKEERKKRCGLDNSGTYVFRKIYLNTVLVDRFGNVKTRKNLRDYSGNYNRKVNRDGNIRRRWGSRTDSGI